ncbi:MFS general substrate transporter, partial [Cryphonectria parasitica EP155]
SEFDNTTFGTYYTYALSDFENISASSAFIVVCDLVFALMKPFWAKTSDIYGRGEMYPVALVFITIGLVVSASARSFPAIAAGTFIRVLGMTAINSMNDVIITDFTTTRQRGFGVSFQFWPYIIMPWISGYVIDSVMSAGGLGWHWGIGIDAICYPVGVAAITIIMLVFQRRARRLEAQLVAAPPSTKPKPSFLQVCAALDLGGLVIAVVSLGFILVPLALASLQPQGYRTPWIIALFVLGPIGLLVVLPLYEARVASNPFFPGRYIKNRVICLAFLLYFLDYMAAASSHSYLYNWAIIAQNMSVLQGTYLSYTNAVTIVFVGIGFGFIMWKTRQYKWWIMLGCVVRMIGYGVMFHIRTQTNPPYAELYVVQMIQGLGDGLVQTGGFVAATINVPHSEAAQMTALTVLFGILGQSVGDAISGAIYTGTFREELARELGDSATPGLINTLFNSITGAIPAWGTAERIAIVKAYNTVTSYFFVAAMVIITPGFILVYLLPNQTLGDTQNLVEEHGMLEKHEDDARDRTT